MLVGTILPFLLTLLQAELVLPLEQTALSKARTSNNYLLTMADESVLADKLNSGFTADQLSPPSLDEQPTSCEHGPKMVLYTTPDEFYWPPIYQGLCYNLSCNLGQCHLLKMVWRANWVLVFKKTSSAYLWVKVGHQLRWFLDHLSCGCRNTVDCKPPRILVDGKCQCPNNSCPTGQIFNSTTCQCDCPTNTVKNSEEKCVHVCVDWQKKPHCRKHPTSKICRCPKCEEQTEAALCVGTYCGKHNNIQCSWNTTCSCPDKKTVGY